MPRHILLSSRLALLTLLALLLAACGGDEGGGTEAPTEDTATGATTSSPASAAGTTTAGTDVAGPAAQASSAEDLDVCSLVSQDEVSEVIGTQAGAPQREDDPSLFYYGCRYEEEDITELVSIGILAWADEGEAESAFEFGADQYPAVEGIGDAAYRSQPIDEITVLNGRYEISVGLFFVSEDDDEEFEMGRQLAEMVIARLP